jgi:hypothetical protein
VSGLAPEFATSQVQSKDASFSAMMFVVVCLTDMYIE